MSAEPSPSSFAPPAGPLGSRPALLLAPAGLALAAAGATLARPSVVLGTQVSKGNLLGTALVVAAVGVPLLLAGLWRAAAGSARGAVVALGALAYLQYQSVLFCFATPMNRLFPLYLLYAASTLWATLHVSRHVGVLAEQAGPALRRGRLRTIAPAALAAFAVLNGLAWLARILPAVAGDADPVHVLDGSGMITSPVWVQDLVFWIPAAVLIAVTARRGDPRGLPLTAVFLVFYVVECLSIAADQAWGAHLDAGHPDLASAGAVGPFLVVAALIAVLVAALLRGPRGEPSLSGSRAR